MIFNHRLDHEHLHTTEMIRRESSQVGLSEDDAGDRMKWREIISSWKDESQ